MDTFRKYVYYILILSYITITCNSLAEKNIGAECILPVRGGKGICKKVTDCPKAQKQNSIGIRPNICSRKNGVIVVCCEVPSGHIHSRIQPPTPIAKSVINPIPSNLPKNQQKCMEYSAVQWIRSAAVPLSFETSAIPIQMSNCSFEGKAFIYGGTKAVHGEFPHMALLGTGSPPNWFCGGSLISEQFVLTAAHCLVDRVGTVSTIRLGELNIVKPEFNSEPEDVGVAEIIKHPSYVQTQVYNDIALIKLARPVTLNMYIRPACLWNKFDIDQDVVTATGWGTTVEDPVKLSDDLLKVGLNIIDINTCKEKYKKYRTSKLQEIRRTLICAANSTGGDTCQGDSGGPIQINDPQNGCIHYIVGVTSAGRGCGNAIPGIYTRVSEYIDWIEQTVWP